MYVKDRKPAQWRSFLPMWWLIVAKLSFCLREIKRELFEHKVKPEILLRNQEIIVDRVIIIDLVSMAQTVSAEFFIIIFNSRKILWKRYLFKNFGTKFRPNLIYKIDSWRHVPTYLPTAYSCVGRFISSAFFQFKKTAILFPYFQKTVMILMAFSLFMMYAVDRILKFIKLKNCLRWVIESLQDVISKKNWHQ
jgi:hypothetical protein